MANFGRTQTPFSGSHFSQVITNAAWVAITKPTNVLASSAILSITGPSDTFAVTLDTSYAGTVGIYVNAIGPGFLLANWQQIQDCRVRAVSAASITIAIAYVQN